MSVRDGSEVMAEGAKQPAAALPNRRAIMFGGVTAGAAGVLAGRSGLPGTAKTRPKARVAAVPPPTVEDDQSVTVLPYSFYGSSGDDFARINTAFGMLPKVTISNNTYTVGRVNLGPFTYAGSTKIIKPVAADLAGAGPGTVLQPQTSGFPALFCHDLNGPPGGYGSYLVAAGTIRDLVIDGSMAGASSRGLSIGDGWGHKVLRVRIQNFTGANAIGLYANNQAFWTEKGHFQCTLWNNTTAAQVDVNGGLESFEFNDFDFDVFVLAGQNGVILTNGAYMAKCDLRMVGNFLTSNTQLSSAALTLTGSGGGFISHISNSRLAIEVESDEGNTFAPQTINFGGNGNRVTGCTGTLIFDDGGWQPSNAAAGQLTFGGVIIGDSQLTSVNASPSGWL